MCGLGNAQAQTYSTSSSFTLVVTAKSHNTVLTWTGSVSNGVSGYRIYRGTSPKAETTTPINSSIITTTTYTDNNVVAGTTYYYVITSVASGGASESTPSNEASDTIPTP